MAEEKKYKLFEKLLNKMGEGKTLSSKEQKVVDLYKKSKGGSPERVVPKVVNVPGKGRANIKEVNDLVKGSPDNFKTTRTLTSGNRFKALQKKIADDSILKKAGKVASKASKVARRGLKSVPILGSLIGIGSALASGDSSAAVPILNEAETLGPKKGTLQHKLESGQKLTKEEMEKLKSKK